MGLRRRKFLLLQINAGWSHPTFWQGQWLTGHKSCVVNHIIGTCCVKISTDSWTVTDRVRKNDYGLFKFHWVAYASPLTSVNSSKLSEFNSFFYLLPPWKFQLNPYVGFLFPMNKCTVWPCGSHWSQVESSQVAFIIFPTFNRIR